MDKSINPSGIFQIGTGFMASKILLSAIKLDLFTLLAEGGLNAKDLSQQLNLKNERGALDLFDAIHSLGFLFRKGIGQEAVYSNTKEADMFLNRNSPQYLGGIMILNNDFNYPLWGNLEKGLTTGLSQSPKDEAGNDFFGELFKDQERLKQFVEAMTSAQVVNFMALADSFNFSQYETLTDMGGSSGMLSIQIAMKHPEIQCTTFDLPPIQPIAEEMISKFHLSDRVKSVGGDFFAQDFPKSDVITMGNILHDWNEEKKKFLIKKAYDALPEDGTLVTIENIIDNDRSQNVFALTMSLNMALTFGDAFEYTGQEFTEWAEEIGFKSVSFIPLASGTSAAIAIK